MRFVSHKRSTMARPRPKSWSARAAVRAAHVVSLLGTIVLRVCEMLLLSMVIAAVLGMAAYQFYSRDLPDPAQLTQHRPFETTRIYARDGETVLYELFADGQRTVVPLADVPPVLKHATLAAEDADFYTHPGVDLRAVVRAVWLNRDGEIRSGASTITQQLARNILLSAPERSQQTLDRKAREAILAWEIHRRFSKEQILGMYLNEVYYGNQAYGIEAAAQTYWNKHARDLTLSEAALLAGVVQAPTNLNPLHVPEAARARRQTVLDLMVKHGYVSANQAAAAAAEPVHVRPPTANMRYPHWVWYVRSLLEQQYGAELVERGGLRVVTSLDPAVQDIVEQAVAQRMVELRTRRTNNASVVVLDVRTNEVLAMVGSANYHDATIDGQFNVALSPRQPGSTLKPIVYAAAMMRGWTPATIILDTPTDFNGYAPQNYDQTFRGPQRLRQALAMSLNIPAVKALQFVGLQPFADLAHAMGITTLNDPDRYGLTAALGGGEAKLIDVSNAYATFANAGRARPVAPILSVTTSHGEPLRRYEPPAGTPALGPNGEAIAYLISDMLSDNAARTPIFGPNSAMRLANDRPAAIKTGTTNDYKDSWAVGYTPRMVVGVWVGNTNNTPMDQVAGMDGAAMIWHDIMEAAHAGQPNEPFPQPAGVVETTICARDGSVAAGCADTMLERFVASTLPSTLSTPMSTPSPAASAPTTSAAPTTVRLVQPAPDTRIAAGTLVLLAAHGSANVQRIEFLVDGHVIGGTTEIEATWTWTATTRGRHTLEVAAYDAGGKRVGSAPVVVVVQ